jgi:hypothetical protein
MADMGFAMLRSGIWWTIGAMELEPAWEATDGDFLPG